MPLRAPHESRHIPRPLRSLARTAFRQARGTHRNPPARVGVSHPGVSWEDTLEAVVMIISVVVLAAVTGDESPGAPIRGTGRWHRVFAIVAATPFRQQTFVIAERRAVSR